MFFKEIVLNGPLSKTKYLRTEFHQKGSPHVYSFVWNFNARNTQDEAAYINFIENTLNAQLLESENEP